MIGLVSKGCPIIGFQTEFFNMASNKTANREESEEPKGIADRTFIEELANSITHGVGLALSVAGFIVLLALSIMQGSTWHIVGCGIFGLTLMLSYLASTLYHSLY